VTKAKPVSRTQGAVDMVDKLLAEMDPQVLLAGALGAVAVKGGIIPPFTRMLMAMSSMGGITDGLAALDKDYAENKSKYLDVMTLGSWFGGGIPGILGTILFQSEKTVDGTTVTASTDQVNAAEAMRGAMAAGALEAMMMMAFMQNPGSMELVGKVIDKVGSGAGAALAAL